MKCFITQKISPHIFKKIKIKIKRARHLLFNLFRATLRPFLLSVQFFSACPSCPAIERNLEQDACGFLFFSRLLNDVFQIITWKGEGGEKAGEGERELLGTEFEIGHPHSTSPTPPQYIWKKNH